MYRWIKYRLDDSAHWNKLQWKNHIESRKISIGEEDEAEGISTSTWYVEPEQH